LVGCHHGMTLEDVDIVCGHIKAFLAAHSSVQSSSDDLSRQGLVH
jgi:hypothetical protein